MKIIKDLYGNIQQIYQGYSFVLDTKIITAPEDIIFSNQVIEYNFHIDTNLLFNSKNANIQTIVTFDLSQNQVTERKIIINYDSSEQILTDINDFPLFISKYNTINIFGLFDISDGKFIGFNCDIISPSFENGMIKGTSGNEGFKNLNNNPLEVFLNDMTIIKFLNNSKFTIYQKNNNDDYSQTKLAYCTSNIHKNDNNIYVLDKYRYHDIDFFNNVGTSINQTTIRSNTKLLDSSFILYVYDNTSLKYNLIKSGIDSHIFGKWSDNHSNPKFINLFRLNINETYLEGTKEYSYELRLEPVPLSKDLSDEREFYLYQFSNLIFKIEYDTVRINGQINPDYIPLSGFKINTDCVNMYNMEENFTEPPPPTILINEHPKYIKDVDNIEYLQIKVSSLSKDIIITKENLFDCKIIKMSNYNNILTEDDISIMDNQQKYNKTGFIDDSTYYQGKVIKFKLSSMENNTSYLFHFVIKNSQTDELLYAKYDILTFNSNNLQSYPFNNDLNDFYFTANQSVTYELNPQEKNNHYYRLVFGFNYRPNITGNVTELDLIDLSKNPKYILNYKIEYNDKDSKIIITHDIGDSDSYVTFGSFYLISTNKNNGQQFKSKVYTNLPINVDKNIKNPENIKNTDLKTLYDMPTNNQTKIIYLQNFYKDLIGPFYHSIFYKNTTEDYPVLWFQDYRLIDKEFVCIENLDIISPYKYVCRSFSDGNYDENWTNTLYILTPDSDDKKEYYSRIKFNMSDLQIFIKSITLDLTNYPDTSIFKTITNDSAFKNTSDKLQNNNYYNGYLKQKQDLQNFTIYILLIGVLLTYIKKSQDPNAEEIFNYLGQMVGSKKNPVELCDTEKEMASSCGVSYLEDTITTELNNLAQTKSKSFVYKTEYYKKEADLTISTNPVYTISDDFKNKLIEQLKSYLNISQLDINFSNYINFQLKSKELFTGYEEIFAQKNKSSKTSKSINMNESANDYKNSMIAIFELYDSIKTMCDVTVANQNLIQDVILVMLFTLNNDFTNIPPPVGMEDLYTQLKLIHDNLLLFNQSLIQQNITGAINYLNLSFQLFYNNIYKNTILISQFGLILAQIWSTDINGVKDKISKIKDYVILQKYLTNKSLFKSLMVGITATILGKKLSDIKDGNIRYNFTQVNQHIEQDNVEIIIQNPQNLPDIDLVKAMLSYKTNSSKNNPISISIMAIKLEKNKSFKIEIYRTDNNVSPKTLIIPLSGSLKEQTQYYNDMNIIPSEFSLEPETVEETLKYIANDSDTNNPLAIPWDKFDEIRKVQYFIDTTKLYEMFNELGMDLTKKIYIVIINNPSEKDEDIFNQLNILDPNENLGAFILGEDGKIKPFSSKNFNNSKSKAGFSFNNSGTYFFASYKEHIICLTSKANVLTPDGYINIKQLKNGTMVKTSDNRCVPIKRVVKMKLLPPPDNLPYLVPASSLAKNYPPKDIIISGKHAILMPNKKDWFIPNYHKEANKNNVKSIQLNKAITYYHIILPSYLNDNLVINGGCIVESCGRSKDNAYFEKKPNGLFKRKIKKTIQYKKINK